MRDELCRDEFGQMSFVVVSYGQHEFCRLILYIVSLRVRKVLVLVLVLTKTEQMSFVVVLDVLCRD